MQATVWRILWTPQRTQPKPVFLDEHFDPRLMFEFSDTSDFQTFLWLFSLLKILKLKRQQLLLFIFNSWSINTPGNMTHQPLAIPHKETGLFGATKIWFWRGVVWFHSFSSILFFTGVFSRTLLSGFAQCSKARFCVELKARGKTEKENFPLVNWQKNVSKGYTPPTHSFQVIKDLQEVMEGEKRGSLEEFFFF